MMMNLMTKNRCTPQNRSASGQIDSEYVPCRLTHPARRAAQAPSPMRKASLPARASPVAKRTSPQSIRKKLRSPQTGSRKRKQRSPQQIVSAAFTTDPVSPLQPDKVSRSSTSPQDTAHSKNPDEHDETLNLRQVNVGHHTFNSISKENQVTVIDSGASMSGTEDRALLSNIVQPRSLSVTHSATQPSRQRWVIFIHT
jgi:hypothetical protein